MRFTDCFIYLLSALRHGVREVIRGPLWFTGNWVSPSLRIEPRSFGLVASSLTCWSISPGPSEFFCISSSTPWKYALSLFYRLLPLLCLYVWVCAQAHVCTWVRGHRSGVGPFFPSQDLGIELRSSARVGYVPSHWVISSAPLWCVFLEVCKL